MSLPQITWQDVRQLPDDGKRYEAIGGELWVTPAPSVRHQRISVRLERALDDLLVRPGLGEIFHAPLGVEFPATGEGVQPDILFVSKERRHERFTDRLPVRLGEETVGRIDLREVFAGGG